MPAPNNSISYNKKELVAEQSGFFWSSLGLLAAVILGTITQAVFSPDRIKAQIQMAADRVHEQMEVSFEHAHLSLADGFWPEIAVVISEVRLISEKKCWLSPDLYANEVKLPLSLVGLITGKITVNTVIVDEAQLRLRSQHVECEADQSVKIAATNPKAVVVHAEDNLPAETGQKNPSLTEKYKGPRNPVENVLIRTFKVTYEPAGVGTVRLDKIRFRRKQDSKDLRVDGMFNLGAETLAADFSSFASFQLEYKAGEDAMLKGLISGNWREGLYDFQIDYMEKKQNLIVLGDLRHIPVSQILPALKKYSLIDNALDGKSLWMSQKISFQGSLQDTQSQVLRIEHLGIEGDLGEIKGSRLEFASLKPLRLKPFELDLHGIGVEKLLKAFNKAHPGPTLGSLGVFSGKLKFFDQDHLELKGDHSGLEFIFSSQGRRESQIISLIRGGISYQAGRWDLDLNEARPLEGIFEGKIDLRSDRDWQNVSLRVNFEELQLSPKVVALITAGGELSPITGKLDLNLDQGQMKSLNGRLQIKSLNYDRLQAKGFSVALSTDAKNLVAKAQVQNLELPPDWSGFQYIEPLNELAKTWAKPLELTEFSSHLEMSPQSALQWKDLRVKGDQLRIQSTGGWNATGIMNGKLALKAGANAENWVLSGHREKLSWTRE
jgi:hypothetical protein